jgi:benzylsuccinate CoA-transferase BbsE subunit
MPDDAGGVLGGLRVLDMGGRALAYAGRAFAELGAEVILVEPPEGSPARWAEPVVATPDGPVSAYFAFMGMGKRSLTLDFTSDRGRIALARLVERSDVVLLGDEPGPVDLDVVTARSMNGDAVVVSASPFGLSGPRRHWRGSDLIAWASSGMSMAIGDPDRPPVAPGGELAYVATSLNAAVGALLALRARRRTERGQLVDISMQEALLSISMEAGPLLGLEGQPQERSGVRQLAALGTFQAKDGAVEIGAVLPGQWDALAHWIRDELGIEAATMDALRGSHMDRLPFTDMINAWVEQLTQRYSKRDFFLEAQRREIPSGSVNSSIDLLIDPHLAATGAWQHVGHPVLQDLRVPRGPLTFDGEHTAMGPVPDVGQHNQEILRGDLGNGLE